MAAPLLSVVIPTRNRRALAAKAVASALAETPFAVEVILSDNASTDSTPELAREFPAAEYRRRDPLLPMHEHWNLCCREARGKYVKLLCDDDVLLPGALRREVEALERNAGASLAFSARVEVGERERVKHAFAEATELAGEELFLEMLLRENLVGPPSSVTFRKESFGGFPPYAYAADWAAWLLLAERGSFLYLPEAGAHILLHESNLTKAFVESATDFLEVQALRRECLRRLTGVRRTVGRFFFAWLYAYRFARRLLRYLRAGKPRALVAFARAAITYERPPLT